VDSIYERAKKSFRKEVKKGIRKKFINLKRKQKGYNEK
jgi:hypothetical protein